MAPMAGIVRAAIATPASDWLITIDGPPDWATRRFPIEAIVRTFPILFEFDDPTIRRSDDPTI
jgi:hypothetical protein